MASSSLSKTALTRLTRELKDLEKNPDTHFIARPLEDDLRTWHFVLHSFPAGSPYHGGCYHGCLTLPPEYPLQPPSIFMFTPNGRFAIQEALCFSMTAYHPEGWNPAWNIRSILLGFVSTWIDDSLRSKGALSTPTEERRRLAQQSQETNLKSTVFKELFPDFARPSPPSAADALAAPAPLTEALTEPLLQTSTKTDGAAPSSSQQQRASSTELVACVDSVHALAAEPPPECWICRDTDASEPLVQPCACRGSMSGVHASCIESWIRHHSQEAGAGGPPSCPVCQQPYLGQSVTPGIGRFVHIKCCAGLRACLHMAIFVCYLRLAADLQKGRCVGWPCILEVAVALVFAGVYLVKILVLTASIPRFQPPRGRWLQKLVVTDARRLHVHMGEVTVFVCLAVRLKPLASLPLATLLILPLGRCALWRWPPSRRCATCCAWRVLLAAAFIGTLVGVGFDLKRSHPHLLAGAAVALVSIFVVASSCFVLASAVATLHPLNAGPHLLTAIGVFALRVLAPHWRRTLIGTLLAHVVALGLGLCERTCVRKYRWRPSIVWVLALYAALVAWGLCGALPPRDMSVFTLATFWNLLMVLLALSANWDAWVSQPFRSWQRRNTAFRLSAAQAAVAAEGQEEPESEP